MDLFPVCLNDFEHLRMNRTIGCTHFLPEKETIAGREISYPSTSLLNNESSGCNIPGVEIVFKESVQPARCDIRQVYCCTSQPSDAMSFVKKFLNDAQVCLSFVEAIIGKSCGHQAFSK